MQFFEAFPKTLYTFSNNESPFVLTHILRRFKFVERIKKMVSEYDVYIIADNETPDIVAYNVYGNPSYHWIIMLFNNIVDPFTDWPINEESIVSFVKRKYGDTNLDSIHHHERNGRVVPTGTEGSYPVTNLQFETSLNEAKRKILLPKAYHIGKIVKEIETVLAEVR